MKKKKYWGISALITIGLCAIGCTTLNSFAKKPFLVGMLFNLEGPYVLVEEEAMRGAELAFLHLPRHHAELADKLGYILYDGKSDLKLISKEAASLANKKNVIAGLGFCSTDSVLAAVPYFVQKDKPFVGTGATSPAIPKDYPGYAFIVAFGDNSQAAAAAEYSFNNLGLRKAALLLDQDLLYSRQLSRYFAESFTAWGGTIVSVQQFPRMASDISIQIDLLKSLPNQPDIIYLACGPEESITILKQLRSAGLSQVIFGGDTFDNRALIESDTILNNVYFTTHLMLDAETTDPVTNNFLNEYISTFNSYPRNPFCALGYDACNLLFNAIERAASFEPEKIREALIKTRDFQGITGTISYFDSDQIPVKPVVVVEIEHDRRYFKASFLPQKVPTAQPSTY